MDTKRKNNLSVEGARLYTKFASASFFMFIIPLILTLYVGLFVLPKNIFTDPSGYIRVIIFLITASGVFGYIAIRRVAKNIMNITNVATKISEGKDPEPIVVSEKNELSDLARAFNRITFDLEKKIKELEHSRSLTKELFRKIGDAITSNQKIDSLLNIIVQSARTVLKADGSFIALYDKKDNRLHVNAYSGSQKDLMENAEIPDDSGVIGLTIQNMRPMEIDKSPYDGPADEKIVYDSIMCVPIIQGGKARGVLAVINKAGDDRIEKDDLPLLENLAVQVATSIENLELNKDIEDTYFQTLLTLAGAVEAKDTYSKDHLKKVASYANMMADKLKLDDESRRTLVGGAMLHDLGKVGISDNILKKTGKLTPEEYEIIKQHSIIGENILRPLRSMNKLSKLVRHHHEHYDGTGYPDGLKGEEIPLLARILTIADIYDAITRDRPYRKASPKSESEKIIRSYAGNKLDAKLVNIFLDLVREEPLEKHGQISQ